MSTQKYNPTESGLQGEERNREVISPSYSPNENDVLQSYSPTSNSSIDDSPPQTLPDKIADTLLVDTPKNKSGVYVERRDQDGKKQDSAVTFHPDRKIDHVTEADDGQAVYFQWAGRVPLNHYDYSTAPKAEDIVLRTSIGLDLDAEKRSSQYDDVEDVKEALSHFFELFNWDRGLAIETNENGGLNVLIPLRPTDDEGTQGQAKAQTYRLLKLLNGTNDLPGLLGPMGADPGATRRIGNMRLNGVDRDGHKITAEWIEGEAGKHSEDGRASWFGPEDFFLDHAVNFLAYRAGVYTPENCKPWNPKGGGLSKWRTAWTLLVYLLHETGEVQTTYDELIEEIGELLGRDLHRTHINRGLEVLGELDVIETEKKRGRCGGTTIRLIGEHTPSESPYKHTDTDETDEEENPSNGVSGHSEKSYRTNNGDSRSPFSSCTTNSVNTSSTRGEGWLEWEPVEGERHRTMVETAVYLVNRKGRDGEVDYRRWVREKVSLFGEDRDIDDGEVQEIWDWAESTFL